MNISKSEMQAIYDSVMSGLENIGSVTEGGDNDMFVDINGRTVRVAVEVEE